MKKMNEHPTRKELEELAEEDRQAEKETPIDKNLHYSDKGGHKERSEANDPRPDGHRAHWKKEKKTEWGK